MPCARQHAAWDKLKSCHLESRCCQRFCVQKNRRCGQRKPKYEDMQEGHSLHSRCYTEETPGKAQRVTLTNLTEKHNGWQSGSLFRTPAAKKKTKSNMSVSKRSGGWPERWQSTGLRSCLDAQKSVWKQAENLSKTQFFHRKSRSILLDMKWKTFTS